MRIGVFTALFQSYPFEEALDRAVAAGVTAVEIGAGGYPGSQHCPVDELLGSEGARQAYMGAITSRGLILSALSVHNNPIHPDPETAGEADDVLKKAIRLAQILEVPVVNGFSGLPAGCAQDTTAKLGHLPLAAPFSRYIGLPVERGGHPLLGGIG